jgi:UDP-glucose 4-epimerase
VKEVIAICEKITDKKARKVIKGRRAGDPPILVASAEKIRAELGFSPLYERLEEIIETAWNWEKGRRY